MPFSFPNMFLRMRFVQRLFVSYTFRFVLFIQFYLFHLIRSYPIGRNTIFEYIYSTKFLPFDSYQLKLMNINGTINLFKSAQKSTSLLCLCRLWRKNKTKKSRKRRATKTPIDQKWYHSHTWITESGHVKSSERDFNYKIKWNILNNFRRFPRHSKHVYLWWMCVYVIILKLPPWIGSTLDSTFEHGVADMHQAIVVIEFPSHSPIFPWSF